MNIKHRHSHVIHHKVNQSKIGETNIAKNGLKMTIIAYQNCDNIDIQFEDGMIVYNKRYNAFKKGTIQHPNIDAHPLHHKFAESRIGETNIAKNGLKMTIIAYQNCNDIDIQFEDGTIVYHKDYMEFQNGSIGHPTINTIHAQNKTKIGQTNMSSNGLQMTILAYRGCNDIDIQFEDDTIVYNKRYDAFKHGQIQHPKYPTKVNSIINNIRLIRKAYQLNDGHINWLCQCQICQNKYIYTYDEIYNHKCDEIDDISA